MITAAPNTNIVSVRQGVAIILISIMAAELRVIVSVIT